MDDITLKFALPCPVKGVKANSVIELDRMLELGRTLMGRLSCLYTGITNEILGSFDNMIGCSLVLEVISKYLRVWVS